MAKTFSKMIPLGTQAPDFSLPSTSDSMISLDFYREHKGLLVAFICNHCPFVKHINPTLVSLAGEYSKRGIGFVGINSNDVDKHPEDSPEKMKEAASSLQYPFEYLFDESQQTAKDYGAECTPDFFLFDNNRRLVWRGRMDGSTPGNSLPATGDEMAQALDCYLKGHPLPSLQYPSVGCNIKWKTSSSSSL